MTALERAKSAQSNITKRLEYAKARELQHDGPNTVAEINHALDLVSALGRDLDLALIAEDSLRNSVLTIARLIHPDE